MKDILMITHYTQVPGEFGNGRFTYIADHLVNVDTKIEMITTDYSHSNKTKRKIVQKELDKLHYKLTLLGEPGYKKNVCLKRFYSHFIFGKNLKKYLDKRKKPDVIYCSVPSLDSACVAAKYAKKNRIKFIIDVQDLWPEAFKMVFNIPLISNT